MLNVDGKWKVDGGADGHGHIKQNVKKVKSSHSLSLSSLVLVWMVLVLRSGKITDAKIYSGSV